MNIRKIIYFFLVCLICANTAVSAQDNALKVYGLKGNPSMLRFRSFELSIDSLTGKLKTGKEMDQFSTDSYRVYFTKNGKVAVWHYVNNGRTCASIQNCMDEMGKFYSYQMHNNKIESYTVEHTYKSESYGDGFTIHSKLKKSYNFSWNNATDTTSLLAIDTVMEVLKNDLLFASYQSNGKILTEYNYKVDKNIVRADFFKNITPDLRIVRIYQNGKLSSIYRFDAKGEKISQEQMFYDDLDRLVLEREDFKRVEVSSGDWVAIDSLPTSKNNNMLKEGYWQYRYEYDTPMDEKGNWLSRNVFWQTDEHPKEKPVWREERKIQYYMNKKVLRGYRE